MPGYTISPEVAAFPYDGTTPSALLRAADNAEMNVKRLGKKPSLRCRNIRGSSQ